MKKSLFVISDLHLGGTPAIDGKPSFQMCSPSGRTRLAEFFRYLKDLHTSSQDVHLVLNGDIVDFLAEEKGEQAFTLPDEAARAKLARIIESTAEVWSALQELLRTGAQLTLLLGNHDIELSLPGPRRLMLDTLGPGRVEFVFDHQALSEGPVLIEHGNVYDGWNVVSHRALLEIRYHVSRNQTPAAFSPPAGSQLVVSVMNGIKEKYPWVDLLKPEDASLFPLLAVLHPPSVKMWPKILPLKARSILDGRKDPAKIGAGDRDKELVDLSLRLAYQGRDPAKVGVLDDLKDACDLRKLANVKDRLQQIADLYQALRARVERTWRTLDVNQELEEYKAGADQAVARGYQVVIFGHTHLVKRICFPNGSVYLNTGTWADLMKVPKAVLEGDQQGGMQALERFVADLAINNLDPWRQQVPTYAKVQLDQDKVKEANVFFFNGKDVSEQVPVPDGPLTKLSY